MRKTFGGFETGDKSEADSASAGASVQSVVTRAGGYALRVTQSGTSTSTYGARSWSTGSGSQSTDFNEPTAYYRVYFRYETKAVTRTGFMSARSSTVPKFWLSLNGSGQIEAYDSGSTLLATGTTVLAPSTW